MIGEAEVTAAVENHRNLSGASVDMFGMEQGPRLYSQNIGFDIDGTILATREYIDGPMSVVANEVRKEIPDGIDFDADDLETMREYVTSTCRVFAPANVGSWLMSVFVEGLVIGACLGRDNPV